MSTPNYRQVKRQLREAQTQAKLESAKIQLKQLERTSRLMESCGGYAGDWGWMGGYQALFDRFRDGVRAPLSTVNDRRHGRNWPLYQTEQDLAVLRGPSRFLLATNDYAIGLANGFNAYVIGSGYSYRAVAKKRALKQTDQVTLDALVDAVDEVIEQFHERTEWYGGEQPNMEEELNWRLAEDGEFIVRQFSDDEGNTDIRSVEPEQLTAKPDGDTMEWSWGIATPVNDVQDPQAYWIFDGDNPSDGEEYSPDEVTHCRINAKRSIKRGCPDFCWSTYNNLEAASRLCGNATEGAAVQAAIAYARQHDAATKEEVTDMQEAVADFHRINSRTGAREPVTDWKAGTIVDMPKGQNFVASPVSTALASLIPILEGCLRGAGRRWNAPQWLASGDASNNNYASSLTAESPFVRTVLSRQGRLKVVYTRIHEVAVRNRCDADGLVAAGRTWSWDEVKELVEIQCSAPSPETRDKLQEAQRRQIELQSGTYSPQQWCADEGRDYDQTMVEIEEHQERTGGQGLPLPTELPGAA